MLLAAFTFGAALISWGLGVASADMSNLPPYPLVFHSDYDYAPSSLRPAGSNTVYNFWCGYGSRPGGNGDVIYFQTYPAPGTSGSPGPVTKVLTPTAGAWDLYHDCDPSIVSGTFTYAGTSYAYALYYTGSNTANGGQSQIGVAFSNNLTTWVKYPNPIVTPIIYSSSEYGAGQQSVVRTSGSAGVRMFYRDTPTPGNQGTLYYRDSTNGITFGAATQITTLIPGGDFAFDPGTNYWYATYSSRGNPNDLHGFVLTRISNANLFANINGWQDLGTFDETISGRPANHNPGFIRDGSGNVPVQNRPNIVLSYGQGQIDPPYTDWDLYQTTWLLSGTRRGIGRYVNPGNDEHISTYGTVPGGYVFEGGQGYVQLGAGAGLKPIFSCRTGGDQFVSTDPGCEGTYVIGLDGYVAINPGSGLQPFYRCYMPATGEHFESTSPSCEGQGIDGLLGYTFISAT
jgi:hypothetical protein